MNSVAQKEFFREVDNGYFFYFGRELSQEKEQKVDLTTLQTNFPALHLPEGGEEITTYQCTQPHWLSYFDPT